MEGRSQQGWEAVPNLKVRLAVRDGDTERPVTVSLVHVAHLQGVLTKYMWQGDNAFARVPNAKVEKAERVLPESGLVSAEDTDYSLCEWQTVS